MPQRNFWLGFGHPAPKTWIAHRKSVMIPFDNPFLFTFCLNLLFGIVSVQETLTKLGWFRQFLFPAVYLS
jgi:hypothetical protein